MQPTRSLSLHLPFLLILSLLLASPPSHAQFQPEKYTLTADEKQQLTSGRDHLKSEVDALRVQSVKTGKPTADLLPDVEIYLDAVDRNLQQDLFFSKANVQQALSCLKDGEARATALTEGKSPWTHQTGVLVLGYRSKIDGSAQPYQIYIPDDYDFAARRPLRLDIFLHGRGGNLNEPTFIRGTGWVKGNFGGTPPHNLALAPYGRGNNGWRWVGEQDVFEALADCQRRYPTDPNLITLRGFSMGGHGTWHIGLQHPGTWAAMSPGAGFVETLRYTKTTDAFADWQHKLLHLYDPVDYADNALNLPLLPYVGETDTFHDQHEIMYAALKQDKVPYQEFLGPQTGHKYETKALASLLEAMAPVRRDPDFPTVDLVTYSLRWPECKWVRIEGLEQHWERAEVHAKVEQVAGKETNLTITTHNVNTLTLTPGPKLWKEGGRLTVDGQWTIVSADPIHLSKKNGKWSITIANKSTVGSGLNGGIIGSGHETLEKIIDRKLPTTELHKSPGLQGPIDDALFGPVLAVAGTGTPWNQTVGPWTQQELTRFQEGWGLYFRATLPQTTDTALTPEQIRSHNLYLFGDPGSNAVLKRILPKLPLKWTKETITLAGKTFSAADHLPLLIFPNPENPKRYVVLNVGLSFSRKDMNGSNAQQYPHLPDYAVIHFDPNSFNDDRRKDTDLAGFFDEKWQISK